MIGKKQVGTIRCGAKGSHAYTTSNDNASGFEYAVCTLFTLAKRIKTVMLAALIVLAVTVSSASAITLSKETAFAINDTEFSLRVGEIASSTQTVGTPHGGIALVGSSSFGRWDSAAADIESMNKGLAATIVSNFGIGGSKSRQWLLPRYVNAVMAKHPRVIVIYGANAIVESPRNASKSSKLVARSFTQTKAFITKCRARAKAIKAKSPKFILVSTVKAPKYYQMSKPTKNSCILWDRFSAYNAKLKRYAKAHADTHYCTIEKYYYCRDAKNRLRYYAQAAGMGKTVSVSNVLKNIGACPFFEADGIHPSERAYQEIWKRIANAIAKYMQ